MKLFEPTTAENLHITVKVNKIKTYYKITVTVSSYAVS